uniref:tRNA wybutosine-synthesizing protein 2/3/4 n=1 Tax=Oryza sativa subsp. japonica TaxID=39947 RepID=TYW23_ORYSJ|nr:RecName: Full=tRNA wybutosine-synthesizing protein 2/3/4; Includes: RecName: Full=tRNA wybutosine-synthesizing protein 3 homolog; Short=tRNA-yW-synthesizing protein 3; AltName: Full=tRNA(Phe) 7-((3-amino-3-carboxypropyl)-4-demethylwyosine(37)-N(4))-methyltransferase; Includes: RecName: Full=tRNA wybutosine-synthesizing protein 2 homolog; Short=tRNA-yW-synthesizing protein 2; AltName: Full=tRNA(Phe) (4-demethylwyosine(37)-C(7)) aminocarboxypropyltransferase [Oryza sativa Japonica Group]BAC20692.
MEFDRRKAAALAALASPAPDKSPKGGVDAPIAPLLDALNSHPDLFTTSSCSGRVSVLAQPPPPQQADPGGAKTKKKARGGGWVYISHDPADPEALVEVLFGVKEGGGGGDDELVFRFEPMIVAVECRDAAAAAALVAAAVGAGFRESGITSLQKRVMVALRCSIRMEVPLGQTKELVVSPDYIRYLVRIANSKMEANKKRMGGFLDLLQAKISLEASYLESQDPVLQNGAKHGFGNAKRHVLISLSFYPAFISPHGVILTQEEALPTLSGNTTHCLSTAALEITGEPIEKLFLWGQSACALTVGREHHILTFGGFGGPGRHARRNYSLLVNPGSGLLTELKVTGSPSPRMGHTITVVGNDIYVVGGRSGPSEILNDIWVLERSNNRWSKVDCSGDFFRPRHRHAAAAVDRKVYVFGGLSDDGLCSCMNIMDTASIQWNVISPDDKWPCARHSHSLVSYGSKLFLFGGHDGQRALNDFYSFDTTTLKWNKENTNGKAPSPRFSHCMFIYKDYLGILGGCPIRESSQEIALLNLKHKIWFYVSIPSLSQCLCVRSSSVIIDDDLVIVGGGASCYAFGTRFSQPIKIDLHLLESIFKLAYNKEKEMSVQHGSVSNVDLLEGHEENCNPSDNVKVVIDTATLGSSPLVLQLEKKYAKLAKDILKKFGWLDLTRKVRVSQDNIHVLFPVSKTFHALITDKHLKVQPDDSCVFEELLPFSENKLFGASISLQKALEILLLCRGSILKDEVAISRKASKTPQTIMRELVSVLLDKKGLPSQLLEQLPTRWETLGDIIVLPKTCFKDPLWESVRDDLWPLVAKSLGAQRLARQGKITPNGTRDSTLELLVGNDGWLTHHENGICYSLDATKCMFSSGNRSEKLRMGKLDCRDEVVVDLFAGIGYFVLPFLVKANAKLVYACEWNPHALEALQRNVMDNHVADRCIILEGDNRLTAPKGIADRVCLGLLPSSECSWDTAVRALRAEGGMLHIHGNVNDSDESLWLDNVVKSITNIAKTHGLSWNVTVEHVERVKWYGPHIRHLVVDVKCRAT